MASHRNPQKIADLEAQLQETSSPSSDERLTEAQFESLCRDRDIAARDVDRLTNELRDAELALARLVAQEAALRADYVSLFEKRTSGHAPVASHPIVAAAMRDGKCGICGTENQSVALEIRRRIDSENCPLCNSKLLGETLDAPLIEKLKKVDGDLIAVRTQIGPVTNTIRRVRETLDVTRQTQLHAEESLDAFEAGNGDVIARLNARKSGDGGLDSVLDVYRTQMREALARKDLQYARRDERLRELLKIQRGLEARYVKAEERFVPSFRQLAKIKLDLNS